MSENTSLEIRDIEKRELNHIVASYEENPSYQLIQKNTGVDIEFIHPAAGTEKESFQVSYTSILL